MASSVATRYPFLVVPGHPSSLTPCIPLLWALRNSPRAEKQGKLTAAERGFASPCQALFYLISFLSRCPSWVIIPTLQTWKVRPRSQVQEAEQESNRAVSDSQLLRQWPQNGVLGPAAPAAPDNVLETQPPGSFPGFVNQKLRDGLSNLDF